MAMSSISRTPLLCLVQILIACLWADSAFGLSPDAAPSTAEVQFTTVSVTVQREDGLPLAGAKATFAPRSEYSLNTPLDWSTIALDDMGRGDVQTTVGARVLFKAWAEGTAPCYEARTMTGRVLLEPVALRLNKGSTLKGRLHHKGGETISSGTLEISRVKLDDTVPQGRRGNWIIDYTEKLTTASVRSDGSFEIIHLPPGTVRVKTVTPGFALDEPELLVGLPEAETKTIELAMVQAGYVVGAVRDEDGKPVSGVEVYIADSEDEYEVSAVVTTDAEGRYRAENVPDKPYYALSSSRGQHEFIERSGINVENVDIRYTKGEKFVPRRYKVSGLVCEANPDVVISDYKVDVLDQRQGDMAITVEHGPEGSFTLFSSSYISHVMVRVSAPGYAPVTQPMSIHEAMQRFMMPKAVRLSGTVTDAVSGDGVANAEVRLINGYYTTTTLPNGSFDFPVFPAGSAELEVYPPAVYRPPSVHVTLEEDAGHTSIAIPLIRAGLLKSRLVQMPGAIPIAGEEMKFEASVVRTATTFYDRAFTQQGATRADGTYNHYESGFPITITLPQRHLKLELPETLESGEVKELQIPLGSSTITMDMGQEEISFFDASAMIDGIRYEYCSDYYRNQDLMPTDHAGRAVLRDLPAGQWTIYLYGTRGSRFEGPVASHDITVPEKGEVAVRLKIP